MLTKLEIIESTEATIAAMVWRMAENQENSCFLPEEKSFFCQQKAIKATNMKWFWFKTSEISIFS